MDKSQVYRAMIAITGCRRPTRQKHGAELSQEASWVGQRLEREELSVGGVDPETKESNKVICSLLFAVLLYDAWINKRKE